MVNARAAGRATIPAVLVNWFSEPGETICDPFMGSSTRGIAAMQCGRHFKEIEIEPRYYRIAVERIRSSTKQGLLN